MKFMKTMMMTGIAALLSTSALAATTAASIKDLPNGGPVTLSGAVEDFNSAHSFMLRDQSGAVKVDLSSTKSVVLTDGEQVTVTGVIDKGFFTTDVAARNVSEDKGVGERIGAAIDSVTGQDAAGSARAVNIQSLPESGIVKINGKVESVGSEKQFTLRDSTGHIDIAIKSGESASLHKGTEVTVIGSVDNGILGKTINATEVDVVSSSASLVRK